MRIQKLSLAFGLVVLTVVLLGTSSNQAQAALLVDFNTAATDISDNFAGTLPGWGATNGINSTGAIAPAANTNYYGVQQTGTPESFSTTGAALEVSSFLRIDVAPPNTPADARVVGLYLAEDAATNVAAGGAGNSHVGVRLNTSGNNTTYKLQARNDNATGADLSGGTFGLTLGNWYKMTVTFTDLNAGTGDIGLNVDIDDYGIAGTSFVSNVVNDAAVTINNLVLTADASVYGGFRIPRGNNLSGLDNFSFQTAVPIPEPSSIALLGLSGLGFLLARRRRMA